MRSKFPLADIFTNADIGNWNFDSTLGLSITFALSAGTTSELQVDLKTHG